MNIQLHAPVKIKLRRARLDKGISTTVAAKKLRMRPSEYEALESIPGSSLTVEVIERAAHVLGVPVSDLATLVQWHNIRNQP